MTTIFGDRTRFSLNIGDYLAGNPVLRKVDIYAAGKLLTVFGNNAYVPAFISCLEGTCRQLISEARTSQTRPFPDLSPAENYQRLLSGSGGRDPWEYRFLNWGETTDDVYMLLFRERGTAILPFSNWSQPKDENAKLGETFVVELPDRDLSGVLYDAAWFLMREWFERLRSGQVQETM